MKFFVARYLDNGHEKPIQASDISPEDYRTIYFKKIYCPNPDCSALLSHYEITKNKHRFFRTFKGYEHIENCTYDKLYNGQHTEFKKSELVKVNVPDKAIVARLKRAYNKYLNPLTSMPVERNPSLNRNVNADGSDNKGIPASFDEGIEADDRRLINIQSRLVSEVSDKDKNEMRCIIGKVYSMKIENDHAYINLTPKKEDSVNVLFNPHFKDRYTSLYTCLPTIEQYIKNMKFAKEDIICCCIGWVRIVKNKNVNHKYNIELIKDVAVTLNGKCLRELL